MTAKKITSEYCSKCQIRRSHQSTLKEINSEYSLKGLMQKLKLQYFDHYVYYSWQEFLRRNGLAFISQQDNRGE